MKLSTISICVLLLFCTKNYAQWAQAITGMGNQVIGALLAEGNTLYASSTFDIYKSTNQGSNWFKINTGLPSTKNFNAIVRSGSNLIAGGDSPGIWLSSNEGASWFRTTNGVDSNEYVYSLFVEGNNVYAAIGYPSAVGVSTNNGNTWIKSTNGLASSQLITGVTKLGSTLYATHSALGVHTSTDNGVTWALSFAGGIGAQDKNAIVTNGSNLCVAATNGVWTSSDSGANWVHTLTTGILSGFGYDGVNLYAVGTLPPYKSSDNGNSWQPIDANGLVSFIQNTMQFTNQYALVNTFGIGVYRRLRSEITSVESEYVLAQNIHLDQNYPNPFNPTTKIRYTIPSVGTSLMKFVQLKVYDVVGNEVATLVDEFNPAGSYEVEFSSVETRHGVSLPSGVYFYKLQTGSFTETRKMVLLR